MSTGVLPRGRTMAALAAEHAQALREAFDEPVDLLGVRRREHRSAASRRAPRRGTSASPCQHRLSAWSEPEAAPTPGRGAVARGGDPSGVGGAGQRAGAVSASIAGNMPWMAIRAAMSCSRALPV